MTLCIMATQAFVHPPATRKKAEGSSLVRGVGLQKGRQLR